MSGTRIRRTEREMVFLTHSEYGLMLEGFFAHWLPLVEFLVASGARFGEVTALGPGDVNLDRSTVHIGLAWKRTYESGETTDQIGAPKTNRLVRTINVAQAVLANLDYEGEWLFTNARVAR